MQFGNQSSLTGKPPRRSGEEAGMEASVKNWGLHDTCLADYAPRAYSLRVSPILFPSLPLLQFQTLHFRVQSLGDPVMGNIF